MYSVRYVGSAVLQELPSTSRKLLFHMRLASVNSTAIDVAQVSDVALVQTSPLDRRIDLRTQLYVEAVLNSLPKIGQREAALALRELGIPVSIAVRVLTRPYERRQSLGRRTLVAGPATAAAR